MKVGINLIRSVLICFRGDWGDIIIKSTVELTFSFAVVFKGTPREGERVKVVNNQVLRSGRPFSEEEQLIFHDGNTNFKVTDAGNTYQMSSLSSGA